jgi:pyridoxal phosphate enzyme (YggS family)
MTSIAENVARVRERIATAARRAGRNPDDIALMAVSKTFAAPQVIEAFAAGVRLFGENRVQEFAGKRVQLEAIISGCAEFHLVGHLQSNKAARATELFAGIDSLDSPALAGKLNAAAEKLGRQLSVLIEINLAGESAKSGLPPASPVLDELLLAAPSLANLRITGLMAIPPFSEDPESSRPYFRALRQEGERIAAQNSPQVNMQTLSMGMSHDFEIAIEEGSNCVRIGTAIFGERPKP